MVNVFNLVNNQPGTVHYNFTDLGFNPRGLNNIITPRPLTREVIDAAFRNTFLDWGTYPQMAPPYTEEDVLPVGFNLPRPGWVFNLGTDDPVSESNEKMKEADTMTYLEALSEAYALYKMNNPTEPEKKVQMTLDRVKEYVEYILKPSPGETEQDSYYRTICRQELVTFRGLPVTIIIGYNKALIVGEEIGWTVPKVYVNTKAAIKEGSF